MFSFKHGINQLTRTYNATCACKQASKQRPNQVGWKCIHKHVLSELRTHAEQVIEFTSEEFDLADQCKDSRNWVPVNQHMVEV
jgi:hypothetical protein